MELKLAPVKTSENEFRDIIKVNDEIEAQAVRVEKVKHRSAPSIKAVRLGD